MGLSMKQKTKQRGRAQAQTERAALPVGTVADILALVREFPIDTVKELAAIEAEVQHEQSAQAAAASA